MGTVIKPISSDPKTTSIQMKFSAMKIEVRSVLHINQHDIESKDDLDLNKYLKKKINEKKTKCMHSELDDQM